MSIREFSGHRPALAPGVLLDPTAVVIGNVTIAEDSSVWPLVVIRGDMNYIRIGARTNIQDGSILHITHASDYHPEGYGLTIGDDVTVGHKALLHGCAIGSRVLIGMGATVMDGVVVEDEVVVAAGCLVPPNKRLVSGFLYVGSPARKARQLSQKELNYFTYASGNYVKLKNQHLESLKPKSSL